MPNEAKVNIVDRESPRRAHHPVVTELATGRGEPENRTRLTRDHGRFRFSSTLFGIVSRLEDSPSPKLTVATEDSRELVRPQAGQRQIPSRSLGRLKSDLLPPSGAAEVSTCPAAQRDSPLC